MKVDRFELENQRGKEAIESGKYTRCEIIVPNGSLAPIVSVQMCKTSIQDMAILLSTLKDTYKSMADRYPSSKTIAENHLGAGTCEIVKKGDKLVDIDENKD